MAKTPSNTRIYAVGDIHGCAYQLADLQNQIMEDAENFAGQKILVFLGDYLDRGLYSYEVMDILTSQPLLGFEHIHLQGNHDFNCIDFLAGNKSEQIEDWIFKYGGTATLESYDVKVSAGKKLPDMQSELQKNMPRSHQKLLSRAKLYKIIGDYLFVHGGVNPDIPLEENTREDFQYTRPPIFKNHNFPYTIVFGHTIFPEPYVADNMLGIDTGAYTGNPLTAVVLEGSTVRFLQQS